MRRLQFRRLDHLDDAVAAVIDVQIAHGVIALPTETFYGLAVAPADPVAAERVFELKGRPVDKALPVLCASLDQVETLVRIPLRWRARLAAVWPAPLTVVLDLRAPLAAGERTLAVRVPAHELVCALLARVGPLTGTSANRSGSGPEHDPDQVQKIFGDTLGLLLDGGDTPGGLASTLIRMTSEEARLLRQGAWFPPAEWSVKPL